MDRMALINPRVEISYWGMEHVVRIAGREANMPAAALPLLAALTPETDSVVLIDENVFLRFDTRWSSVWGGYREPSDAAVYALRLFDPKHFSPEFDIGEGLAFSRRSSAGVIGRKRRPGRPRGFHVSFKILLRSI
jgi:hypothetical protein